MTGHFSPVGRIRVPDQPIDLTAYDVLWELALGDTPKPHVLDCVSPGDTAVERAEIQHAARARLRQVGHLDGQGVRPEVKDLLHVLASPQIAVNMRWFVPQPDGRVMTHTARIAQRGGFGVVARLDEQWVWLWLLGGRTIEQQVRALVQKWAVPPRFSGETLLPDQIKQRQMRPALATALIDGRWQCRWYITVSAYNHAVSREYVSAALTISDNLDGRYLAFPSHRNQIVITPDTTGTLERRVTEMIKSVRANPPEETEWLSSFIS